MANFFNDNKDLKFHLTNPLMKTIVALKESNYSQKDIYDYAPMDYEDAIDSYQKVLDTVGEICGNIVAPNAVSVDQDGPELINNEVIYARGTRENYEALKKAGLIGMSLPREYNGLNFPFVPYVMAAEIVSRADGGFSNIWGLQDCAETINEFASKEVRDIFLPRFPEGATAAMDLTEPDAGSDLQTVQMKAHYDESAGKWFLNGVKRFITNGDADISLVLARSEEGTTDGRGLSLFVYDRKDNAVIIRRIENKLGIKGSPTCELVFRNAPAILVGDRKLGLIKYVMSLMNSARLGVGAQSVGIAEAAYREATKYAAERIQFGKPIVQFPAVYEMLTYMKVRIQAVRSLLYETSRYVDMYKLYSKITNDRKPDNNERAELKKYQKLADAFTPLVKLTSSEYCNQIAYDSLQIHGGAGYMKDFPVERIYRDARITSIYEGTSQLQVVAAVRSVTTGVFTSWFTENIESIPSPELQFLRKIVIGMIKDYEEALSSVTAKNDTEFTDFHARRLVEIAANIVMSILLLKDSVRDNSFARPAEIFIKRAFSLNTERCVFISNSELKDLGIYKPA